MGKCRTESMPTVYASTNDVDYKAILDLVSASVRKAWDAPRRDLASLKDAGTSQRPSSVREEAKTGVQHRAH